MDRVPVPYVSGGLGLLVYDRLGNLCKSSVRFFFFVQSFLKQGSGIGEAKFLCPSAECSVSRNLVVLHSLSRR